MSDSDFSFGDSFYTYNMKSFSLIQFLHFFKFIWNNGTETAKRGQIDMHVTYSFINNRYLQYYNSLLSVCFFQNDAFVNLNKINKYKNVSNLPKSMR